MIFRHDQLRLYFRHLRSLGATRRFRDWSNEKVFLVRHDIDFDLDLAAELANIEHEEGVVSTFFILMTSDCYNPASGKNRAVLKRLINLGHEVGLHFDPTLYRGNLDAHVKKEAAWLEELCGEKVTSISLHNPSIHGQYPLFADYVNAYDPAFFSDSNYISDSTMNFRGKDPLAFAENIQHSMVQILLHPMHYSAQGEKYDLIVCKSFLKKITEIHTEFLANKTYKSDVGHDIKDVLRRHLA
jgi:hypothetical protein